MSTKDERFFKDLGARVAQLRKDQALTQAQLAERLGIAQQTLAHYEVGRLRAAGPLRSPAAESRVALTLTHYHGNVAIMPLAHSKLTAQGQISVPAEIRKKLGVGPGSVLEWDEKDDEVIVRKAGRHTLADVHEALFPDGSPKRKASASVKEGITKHIRQKHARR